MKKLTACVLAALLMLTCVCAFADDTVTAEELLNGNGLRASLVKGTYMREYVEYYDAEGNVYDYNDIIYKRGETGYNMLMVYPENSGESVGAMLVGGNFYVEIENGIPSYTLYASTSYEDATAEMEISDEAYTAYPAFNDGTRVLSETEDGGYVVTAQIPAEKCDQNVVAANGHDAAEGEIIYDQYTYDSDKSLVSEELYYMRDDEKVLCEKITFEYDTDGTVYEQYAQSVGTREIAVVLNPGKDTEKSITFSISDSGNVTFVMGSSGALYADAACTQAVESSGDGASFTQSEYYAVTQ